MTNPSPDSNPSSDPGPAQGKGGEPQAQPHTDGPAAVESATVQIADQAGGEVPATSAAGETPYQNLWIPLIVVPAGIVMALVGVFALFGAISTDTNTLSDNLGLVVRGGANERDQALFALMQQAAENNKALAEDRELPHAIEPGFAGQVSKAMGDLDGDEHNVRLALAILLGTLDDERGAESLAGFLDMPDVADEDGKLRIAAIHNLALLAEHSPESVDPATLYPRLEKLLKHPDAGLRGMSTSLLGGLRTEQARKRLVEVLGDENLGVRASAALALARLDPPEPQARALLTDLTGPELYASARQSDPKQFRRPDDVSRYRIWAIAALARYEHPDARVAIEGRLKDADLRVREAAMLALGEQ